MAIYKATEIQNLSELSKIQLIHLVNTGAIVPYVDDRRRGGVRQFSEQNLIEALICKALIAYQLPNFHIVWILDFLRREKIRNNRTFWQLLKKDSTSELFVVSSPVKEFDKSGLPKFSGRPGKSGRLPGRNLFVTWVVSKKDMVNIVGQIPTAIVVNLRAIVDQTKSL